MKQFSSFRSDRLHALCLPLHIAISALFVSGVYAAPPWPEILRHRQDPIQVAQHEEKVIWHSDLLTALEEARRTDRPLFVTLRCVPCKQCADFDKDVLEGGPALSPLLAKFITVRLTDARAIDLRLLPVEGFQDLDLSWWGWLLSPQGQVYGVYGGRDEVSDNTRISVPSLAKTLERVLAWHSDPRRAASGIDGMPPDLREPARTPLDLPGAASWLKKTPPAALSHQGQSCVHCHMVADILRTPAIEAKTFDKVRDTQIWPLPENVGISLERDDGLRVTAVAADGAAAKAGVQPGDTLAAAGGRLLFSQADFRGVLHRGPRGTGEIELWWLREGEPISGSLHVTEGWRKTVLDWRMSISQGVIGVGPGFFPLPLRADKRKLLGLPPDHMAIEPFMGKDTTSAAYQSGLRSDMVITAVDAQSPPLAGRAFLTWFRMRHEPGDGAVLKVRTTSGEEWEINYFPAGRE